MYGMVLMAAMTGSGDTAGFGHKKGCSGGVPVSGCYGSMAPAAGYSMTPAVGCYGSMVPGSGCYGSMAPAGCLGGGKHGGGGGLFGKHHKNGCMGGASCYGSGSGYGAGCYGSGYGSYAGCTGVVVVPPVVTTPMPAPVVTTPMPAPVAVASPCGTPCETMSYYSAPAKKGLFGGLCKKKQTASYAMPYAMPCATAGVALGTTGGATPMPMGALTADEQRMFDELVANGTLKKEDIDTWKGQTAEERKAYYEKYKTPAAKPLTAEEMKWFDELVANKTLKKEDLDAWKAQTPEERKAYYEKYKKPKD